MVEKIEGNFAWVVPDALGFHKPLVGVPETVGWQDEIVTVYAADAFFDRIDVERTVQEYGWIFAFHFLLELDIILGSLLGIKFGPGVLDQLIGAGIAEHGQIEARIFFLGGIPERIRIRISSHYLAEEQRFIFSRSDVVLLDIGNRSGLDVNFGADFFPLSLQNFCGLGQFLPIGGGQIDD